MHNLIARYYISITTAMERWCIACVFLQDGSSIGTASVRRMQIIVIVIVNCIYNAPYVDLLESNRTLGK